MAFDNLKKCPECEDGKCYILNAYDPDFKEEVDCDMCGGMGFTNILYDGAVVMVDEDEIFGM